MMAWSFIIPCSPPDAPCVVEGVLGHKDSATPLQNQCDAQASRDRAVGLTFSVHFGA